MDNLLFLSTVFCAFLPLITIFALTPYISRKGTCFGVLLMEDVQKSSKIRKLKRDFSVAVSIIGVMFAGASTALLSFNILAVALISYCAGCLVLYLASNLAVRNMVMTENWENFQKEINVNYVPVYNKKGAISTWWYILYLPIIGFVWYASYGKEINYGYVLPVVQIVFGVIMIFVHFLVRNSSQYANKKNVEKSIEQNQIFRREWSLFVYFVGLVTQIMLVVLQLGVLEIITHIVFIYATPFIVTILITAAAISIAFKNNK